MEKLPKQYQESMQELLGEEYAQYIESFLESSYTAFRINTNKVSLEQWKEINPFSTSEVAWIEKGFYYDAKKDNPAKHPYYFAGLYYIQEPSAMIPASLLPVEKGDKVLDLCAAPGGKATELGAKLKGTGLLVANDISVSRTMALAKNLQMAGISNAVVTAETPEKLSRVFIEYFDKILIDAPCSGEGMFRREPRMIKDWLEKGPEYYAKVQKEILSQAYEMLKPGGMLVYSTCTFSVLEDENVIQWLITQYPDMKICPVLRKEGFADGRPDLVENGSPALKHCVRIFPHRAKGEGHFAVLLRKKGHEPDNLKLSEIENGLQQEESTEDALSFADGKEAEMWSRELIAATLEQTFPAEKNSGKKPSKKKSQNMEKIYSQKDRKKGKASSGGIDEKGRKEVEEFLCKLAPIGGILSMRDNMMTSIPILAEELRGIRTVYQGMPLCEWKHKLAISHQLALALKKNDFSQVLDLSADDERVIRYLKGETISMEEAYQGNVLVCVDGFGLGWGQGNGQGTLKNKYYPGWRYQ